MVNISQLTLLVGTAGMIIDTDDLVRIFGVPKGKMIVIHSILLNANVNDSQVIITFDREDPVTVLSDGEISHVRDQLSLGVAVATNSFQYLFGGKGRIVNNNIIITASKSSNLLAFDYSLVDGDLDWAEETAEVLPDIKQVSSRESKSEGMEYFQAGDFNQVGEPD